MRGNRWCSGDQRHPCGVVERGLRRWFRLGCRLQSLELKFPVLEAVDQTRNDREASCNVGLVRCPNFEIPVCLKFLGTFAECLSKTFTKLQLGFTLGRIAIGESLLADVVDGGDNLLEFGDSKRDLFEWSRLRSGSLLFRRARSSHDGVEKV